MKEDLRDLYQEVILDHSRKPRNFREMKDANRKIDGFNPLCGDKITLYMKVEKGIVRDVSFQGVGCAISTASASMLTEELIGKTEEEANASFKEFHEMVTAPMEKDVNCTCLGKLEVFTGIREFPMRVKCATLCWHALHAALNDDKDQVSSE